MQKSFFKTEIVVATAEKKVEHDPAKYKTVPCKNFDLNGSCDFGDKCLFAHGVSDLRRIPPVFTDKLCVNLVKDGGCPYGNRCKFPHSESELKKNQKEVPVVKKVDIEKKKPVKSFEEEFPSLPIRPAAKSEAPVWVKPVVEKTEKVEKSRKEKKQIKEETEESPLSSMSESELVEFTKEFLSPTGKFNFADDDPEEDFIPEDLTDKMKKFMDRKVEKEMEKVERVEKKTFNKAVGSEKIQEIRDSKVNRELSLDERARSVKISDLVLLKENDPVLFGYCVGLLAGQKML